MRTVRVAVVWITMCVQYIQCTEQNSWNLASMGKQSDIKEVIDSQKGEKRALLSIQYVAREQTAAVSRVVDSDLVKVITGPRRAGKSVFALMLLKEKEFGYVNFDDERLVGLADYDKMIEAVFQVYPNAKYLLFDEIQNLKHWELFVNRLHRRGLNLTITGSNSKLLSSELSTALTGRHIPIELLPFSVREYTNAKGMSLSEISAALPETKGKILGVLEDYLIRGGYPEVATKELDAKSYLKVLLESTLFKDVVRRYNVRYSAKIGELATYLSSDFPTEFTFTKLKNSLGFNSVSTVQNYVKYLEESFIYFVLNRYSHKLKEQLKASRKAFLVDNGFGGFESLSNKGKLLENAVFGDLVRRGYRPNGSLFFYRTRKNREIDFVLRQDRKTRELIQVTYRFDEKTNERETKALVEAADELNCENLLMITWDQEGEEHYSGKLIKYTPFWKWALSF